jgi:hypothetical protein
MHVVEESAMLALLGLPGVYSVQEVRAQDAVKHYVVRYELDGGRQTLGLVRCLRTLWPFGTIEVDQKSGLVRAEFLVRPSEAADFCARASLLPLPQQGSICTLALEFVGPLDETEKAVLESCVRSTDSVVWRGDRVAVVHLNGCTDPAAAEARIAAAAENAGLQVRTVVRTDNRSKNLAAGA